MTKSEKGDLTEITKLYKTPSKTYGVFPLRHFAVEYQGKYNEDEYLKEQRTAEEVFSPDGSQCKILSLLPNWSSTSATKALSTSKNSLFLEMSRTEEKRVA